MLLYYTFKEEKIMNFLIGSSIKIDEYIDKIKQLKRNLKL